MQSKENLNHADGNLWGTVVSAPVSVQLKALAILDAFKPWPLHKAPDSYQRQDIECYPKHLCSSNPAQLAGLPQLPDKKEVEVLYF